MENLDLLFKNHKDKYNTSVVLSKKDLNAGVKILSKEDYAQSLYNNLYAGSATFNSSVLTKDLEIDKIYSVKVTGYDRENRLAYTEEITSGTSVFVPVRELNIELNKKWGVEGAEHIQDMVANGTPIKVMIYRKENGEFYASERKCANIIFRQELEEYTKSNTFFNVKVIELIEGGYIALYKNSIKCFLPGSQAAANIITDFSKLLGQEIPVMIENFDTFNNLYIVSYKKYIKNTLSSNVHKLKFGPKYTGVLTNKPHNFGVFVEWDNYFTGLIHQTDFDNYQMIMNTMKAGDSIEFYIKDITLIKGETRIVLTTKPESINATRLAWQELKDLAEGKTLDYVYDKERNQLEFILPNNTSTYVNVDFKKVQHFIRKSTQVKVGRIDTIRQFVKFDFVL